MNTLRLIYIYFRVSVLNETAYRVNFFVLLFQSVLEMGTALAGLAVIFTYTNNLGGWRPDEMLALVGVYFLVGGLISLVIQPSMTALIDSVRDGTLDFILTKPEDAQLLVSIQRMAIIWSLLDLLMGLSVIAAALVRLGNTVGFGEAAAFTGMLLAGAVIVYSFWLILASLSFWLVRVENLLEIFQSVYQAGRWPVSLYPNWLRFGLTFIVPVAFATTLPAEALTGRLGSATLLEAVGLAVLLFGIARLVWQLGLRRYSGASA
jgi:ABC-2 type transport system permease protein